MENGARHPYFVALFDAAKAVHSSLILQDVLQEIVRRSADTIGAKAASLRLLKPGGETLTLCAAYGLSRDYLNKGPVLVSSSPIDRCALLGETVVIRDARTDPRFQYRAEAAEENICSVLCVPVMHDGQGVGVLRVYSDRPRTFDQGEIELLTAMSTLGAIAIRNAETHTRTRDDLRAMEQYVAHSW